MFACLVETEPVSGRIGDPIELGTPPSHVKLGAINLTYDLDKYYFLPMYRMEAIQLHYESTSLLPSQYKRLSYADDKR